MLSQDCSKRNKWKIGWGVTSKCNMKCRFCYSRKARNEDKELPLKKLTNFVNRNAEYIESINYGTGENTLSKRWFELVAYIRDNHPWIKQALTTNGTLAVAIENRSTPWLFDALDEVDVSFDFCNPTPHCEMRYHGDSHKWAMQTIQMCRDKEIPTTLVIMCIDATLDLANLKGIFDIAEQYGCYVRLNIYRPTGESDFPLLSSKVLVRALDWILAHNAVVSLADPLFSSLILNEAKHDCSGRSSLRILPDGSVTASTYLVQPRYRKAHISDLDLRENDEISSRLLKPLGDVDVMPPLCESCPYCQHCRGGAMDRRILWYGTLKRRDPYCPLENGGNLYHWQEVHPILKEVGPTVHDGYLPTLIFSPGTASEKVS